MEGMEVTRVCVTHLNHIALPCWPCPTSLLLPTGAVRNFAHEPPGPRFFGTPLSCLLDLPRSLFFFLLLAFPSTRASPYVHVQQVQCQLHQPPGLLLAIVTLLFASHCAKDWNMTRVCPDANVHELTFEILYLSWLASYVAHPSTQCAFVIIRSTEAHETLRIA